MTMAWTRLVAAYFRCFFHDVNYQPLIASVTDQRPHKATKRLERTHYLASYWCLDGFRQTGSICAASV